MSSYRFIIQPDGDVRCLVGHLPDELRAKLGAVKSTRRVSHVETWKDLSARACFWLIVKKRVPCAFVFPFLFACPDYQRWLNYWWADMSPVRGPVLGPFEERQEALDAEVEWLYKNHLPKPVESYATDRTNAGN
jgi:hypothetical protein